MSQRFEILRFEGELIKTFFNGEGILREKIRAVMHIIPRLIRKIQSFSNFLIECIKEILR
jgi:hypothetical protein